MWSIQFGDELQSIGRVWYMAYIHSYRIIAKENGSWWVVEYRIVGKRTFCDQGNSGPASYHIRALE